MLVDCARCVDLDPRKYDGHLNIPEAFRLLENILAGEVVAALLEELFEHNSLAITGDLKDLVSKQTWPEISITICHYSQFSVRGIADEKLLQQALQAIPEDQYFEITDPAY
jgi:hypothetical protein